MFHEILKIDNSLQSKFLQNFTDIYINQEYANDLLENYHEVEWYKKCARAHLYLHLVLVFFNQGSTNISSPSDENKNIHVIWL